MIEPMLSPRPGALRSNLLAMPAIGPKPAKEMADLAPFGFDRGFGRMIGWPNIEVSDTGKEVKVTAELPGLEEKDVELELANGVLAIKGEKRTGMEDKGRLFSERYYGRFERRIPVEDIDEDKVSASFRNGALTVSLPKTAQAQRQVKRIAINER